MIGETHKGWLVQSKAPCSRGSTRQRWHCKCVLCGELKVVRQSSLLTGNPQKCKCSTKAAKKSVKVATRDAVLSRRYGMDLDGDVLRYTASGEIPDDYRQAIEVNLDDFVEAICPQDYGADPSLPSFSLQEYFITSGEAISKVNYALRVFARDRQVVLASGHREYLAAVKHFLSQVEFFRERIVAIRGEFVFLESIREDGVLTFRRTGPREASQIHSLSRGGRSRERSEYR